MAFYEGWGKKIQQTGQGAIDKTKKGAESVRINNSISNLEREITKEYTELGRAYYQKYADSEQDPDLLPYFQKIKNKMESIQNYRDQLDEMKGLRKCPACGKFIDAGAAFCNFCGARQAPESTEPAQPASPSMPKPTPQSAPEPATEVTFQPEEERENAPQEESGAAEAGTPVFCTNCGEKLEPGDVFCTNCGQKIE